ncbi:MAG: hypothetical protein ACC707_19165, partial [Thiohalomonadales bacterium]
MFNTSAGFIHVSRARLSIVLALLLAAGLVACDTKKDSGSKNSLNDGLILPMPLRFNSVDQAVIADKKLSIKVRLTNNDSGGTSIYKLEELTISETDGKKISGKITGVPTGSYTMSLEYYILVGDVQVLVVKTDPVQTSANPQSETVIEFTESMNDYIDEDGDGRTNLHEISKGTSWTAAGDFPPPDAPLVDMAVNGMRVNLSWKNEGGADTYTVYVSENPFTIENAATFATFVETILADKNNNITEYPTGYLNKNVSYYIAVKSNDDTGKGDTSTPTTINPAAFLANIE